MSKRIRRKAPLTIETASHGATVRRGFNQVFLTWASIRDLEALRKSGELGTLTRDRDGKRTWRARYE